MYKIKECCYDYFNGCIKKYYDEPLGDNEYESKEDAYNNAYKFATNEADGYNKHKDELNEYKVEVDGDKIVHNCYVYASADDKDYDVFPITIFEIVKEG